MIARVGARPANRRPFPRYPSWSASGPYTEWPVGVPLPGIGPSRGDDEDPAGADPPALAPGGRPAPDEEPPDGGEVE